MFKPALRWGTFSSLHLPLYVGITSRPVPFTGWRQASLETWFITKGATWFWEKKSQSLYWEPHLKHVIVFTVAEILYILLQKMLALKRWLFIHTKAWNCLFNKSPDKATYEWPKEASKLIFRFYMTCVKNFLKYLKVLCPDACNRLVLCFYCLYRVYNII